ncbi:MAG: hypothetical protein NC911_03950 [Candidatus Omnitrophica bacterium]|nr:hypothetical protein [Candidatus Omnitrophota bacterium]
MKISKKYAVSLSGLLLTGCAIGPPSFPPSLPERLHPFSERRDALFSPGGSVPAGQSAFSPDGQFYAKEVEPINEGNIGVFSTADNHLVAQIKAQKGTNDLKGLAWSSDSVLLAVMYHGGDPDGISIYHLPSGQLVRQIPIDAYYHFMVFGQENHLLHLAVTIDGPVQTAYLRRDTFVSYSGVNLPWINYGWDVGRNPWGGKHGGFSSHREQLLREFSLLAQHQVGVIRVFIFCDLRSSIIFDSQGEPVSLDKYVFNDFQALLESASLTGLKLIPVIFDYTLADGVENEKGIAVGEHRACIEDPKKREKLLRVITPFFRKFAQHPAVLAWDIFNEPENVLLTRKEDIDRFLQDIAGLFREICPKARLTIGARDRESLTRWRQLNLDLYQFHHFSSPESLPALVPRKEVLLPAKPIILGECPPSTVLTQLEATWQANYAGCLFWSLNDVLNEQESFRSQLSLYRAWVSVH